MQGYGAGKPRSFGQKGSRPVTLVLPPARPVALPADPQTLWWLIEGRLAGAPRPGRGAGAPDLGAAALREMGVSDLVSLTAEWAPPAELFARHGLAVRRMPVSDMAVPNLAATRVLVAEIGEMLARGGTVCVHCAAGQGRTGTVLAAVLIASGQSAEQAVRGVRAANPRAIETAGQMAFLNRFAAGLQT